MNKILKEYRVKNNTINMQMYGGAGVIGLSILSAITIGIFPSIAVVCGIFMIVMGFWLSNTHQIKLYPEHFEMKFAPLAKLKLVKYETIVKIEERKRGVVKIYSLSNSKESKATLVAKQFEIRDIQDFYEFLKAQNPNIVFESLAIAV